MTEIFLTFDEDDQKREIPVVVRGDMNDATISHYVAEARKVAAKDFDICDLERVIIVQGKIVNFVTKKGKKK